MKLTKSDWKLLQWVALAKDPESARYCLSGILIDEGVIVATDARRLHAAHLGKEKTDFIRELVPLPEGQEQLIVAPIASRLGAWKDSFATNVLAGNAVRALTGRFPEWRNVIGREYKPADKLPWMDPRYMYDATGEWGSDDEPRGCWGVREDSKEVLFIRGDKLAVIMPLTPPSGAVKSEKIDLSPWIG